MPGPSQIVKKVSDYLKANPEINFGGLEDKFYDLLDQAAAAVMDEVGIGENLPPEDEDDYYEAIELIQEAFVKSIVGPA